MSTQAIFNAVAAHLLTQMEKSLGTPPKGAFMFEDGPQTICLYRCYMPDKVLKCAAGVLIEDNAYTPAMENKSVASLQYFKDKYPTDYYFIDDLQTVHDGSPVTKWRKILYKIARDNNLDPEVCWT